ncbi:hypothetical protein BH09MYX1_BH09MYX1_45420 [soil metagenome]
MSTTPSTESSSAPSSPSAPTDQTADRPLIEEGCLRLEALARALGFDADVPVLLATFRQMTAGWGAATVGRTPHWPSDVSDDHTPFELSVAFHQGEPEIRILAEAMDFPPSSENVKKGSLRLNDELAREGKIVLDRVRQIEDLFLPPKPEGRFLVWHAAVFRKGRAPDFKIYFNLHVQGKSKAPVLAEQALRRLGFANAWPTLAEAMARRSSEHEELLYFSLDLAQSADARTKFYVRHHRGTASDLEIASSYARAHEPGEVTAFARAIGGDDGPYGGRGPATCVSFTDPNDDRPASATSYIPTPWAAPSDAVAHDRIVAYLRDHGIAHQWYESAVRAFVRHPLESGSSLHSYAAYRLQNGPRLTTYFAPELYRAEPARKTISVWVDPPQPPPTEIVQRFETNPFTDHPLFARLRSEPVDLVKLAILMANFKAVIVDQFPRRLATLTARVPDEAIRSILAKQLNDELGNGDITRAHRVLFEKITTALKPWLPSTIEADTAPGRAFGKVLERCYVEDDPFGGVGAALLVEVGGKQVDTFIGDEFRRQTTIPPSELEWLHLHEELEIEHADEAMDLAKLIPESSHAAAWRGGMAIGDAARDYFDALYRRYYR